MISGLPPSKRGPLVDPPKPGSPNCSRKGPFLLVVLRSSEVTPQMFFTRKMVQHETNHTEDMTEVLFSRICKQRNEKNVFVEKRGGLKGIVGTWWSTMNHIGYLGKLSLGKSNSFLFLPPIVVVKLDACYIVSWCLWQSISSCFFLIQMAWCSSPAFERGLLMLIWCVG